MARQRVTKPSCIESDDRAAESDAVEQLKADLTTDTVKAAKKILVDLVARNNSLEKQVYEEGIRQGVIISGKVNAVLKTDMLKFQAATRAALVEIGRLGGSNKKPTGFDDSLDGIFDDYDEE